MSLKSWAKKAVNSAWDHTLGNKGLGGVIDGAYNGIGDGIEKLGHTVGKIAENIGPDIGNFVNNATGATQAHDWAVQDASTAHQREYQDLMATGINPVQTAGGSGSNVQETGGGGSANVGIPGVSDAINTALTLSEIKNKNADSELKAHQSGKTDKEIETMNIQNKIAEKIANTEIKLKNATTELEKRKAYTELLQSMSLEFDNRMKRMDVDKRSNQYDKELEIYKNEIMSQLIDSGFDNTTIGLILKGIGKTGNALGQATSAVGNLKGTRAMPTKSYGYVTTH